MNDVRTRDRKVTVAARVPLDLAAELGRMAEAGNRTVSREIWAAVAEHVERESFSLDATSSSGGRDVLQSSHEGPAVRPGVREGAA